MRKIYFVAEWLRDDCLTDEGFESDCIEQTNLDDLEEAKEMAIGLGGLRLRTRTA